MCNVRSGFVVLLSTFVPLSAQWLHYATPGTPRMPDGKADLLAPAPKTPDGKPDLSGIWEVDEQQSVCLRVPIGLERFGRARTSRATD